MCYRFTMKIYACNISQWNELSGCEFLSTERKQRMERYRQHRDKVRCLVAGLLLHYAFGHNKSPLHTEYGKPYFEDDLCFNISHSGDYVILAKSAYTVGIDVEKVKPYNIDVAKKCFTALELEWLMAQEDDAAFYKIWAAKESIMKATGLGFTMNPSSFQVLPIQDGPHIINTEKWYLYWHSLNNHEVCVVSTSAVDKNNDIIVLEPSNVIEMISHTNQAKPEAHHNQNQISN